MANLDLNTPVSVAYSGGVETYVATSAGQVTVHMWGGAGAGGYYSGGSGNTDRRGGAGGYATVRFFVKPGDILSTEVGQGGQVATGSGATVTSGGNGGWPDGGFGGKSSSNTGIGFGGGGGSTRLYKNGELVAVAGGGGGATGFYYGGNGGGVSGWASTDASSGGGGTQTAGGATGTGVTGMAGSYFQGGLGAAVQATAAPTAGAGGGGGYYGGGSNGGASGAHGSGGGGSGYINSNGQYNGALKAGQNNTGIPYDVSGVRGSGIAEGGTGPTAANSWNLITPGGNGQLYMTLADPSATATTFPTSGTTTLSYTGSRLVYVATQLMSVDFEMWGGGGSGGFYTSGGNSGVKGGAGGYTKLTRIFYPGDIVEIEVAQGGQAPTSPGGLNIGGVGGWPNGGDGGRPTTTTNNMGGGGGSSNIFVNGRLLAVAAGGGGSTGFYNGGNGGGRYGLADAATTNSGNGGTWALVGTGLNRAYLLLGGHGSPNETRDVAISTAGAGGGGGYWGGGGARGGANTHGAGGGGCGYHSGDNTYNRDMQIGVAQSGNPYSTAARPAGVGQGGVSGTTAGTTTNGGDGAIVFTVTPITPTTLPTDKTALSFTGAPVHYIADSYGAMSVKAWAAGGGGGTKATGTAPRGGGGGFAQIPTVKIKPGDIITCVVGEGGRGQPSGTLGGRGGYPNGEGGNAADATGGSGGGGGSSHVYLNGELILVAGGGGGGSISFGGASGGQPSYAPSSNSFETHGSSLNLAGWAPQRALEGNNRATFMLGGMGQIDGNLTIDTPNSLCGGGGGGGYYGGAGSVPLNSRFYGGGAGTTYIHPSYVGSAIVATVSGSNTTDADWVSGISVAGQGSNTVGSSTLIGGNGRIVIDFDIPATLNESATTAVPVQSNVQTYMVGSDGDLVLNAWGGGGGGSTVPSGGGGERGGGGGYAAGTVTVKKGQIIKFYNGRGGGGATYTSGTATAMVGSGGLGGWPDGGNGGLNTSCISGGGGGSSRIYIDDVLMFVAGAGGGVGAGSTTTTPGGGGGTTGGNSDAPSGQNNGGLQYIGGRNSNRTTDTTSAGGLFKGGHGYITGGSITVSATTSGAGGGGGLFGGSGSGGSSSYIGGAGGSGFIADGYGVTPADPYRPYVGLQWSFESGSFIDDGRTTEVTLLDTAPTLTTTGPKYGTACANINNGHVTANIPVIGTQDFTLEGWFNPTTLATGVMMIIGNNSINGLSLHYYPSATVLALRYNNTAGDGSADYKYTDTNRAAGVWAHYAVTRDANGTRVYKDGKLVTNVTGVAVTNITATTLTLGNYNAGTGASTRFTGKIDEVRLTVGVSRYKQNFNPQPFQNKFSQIPAVTTLTQGSNGATGQPAGTAVSGYLSGRGVGAQTTQSLASGVNGGDGQINYFLQTSTVAATGSIGTITMSAPDAVAGAFYPLTAPGTKIVENYSGQRVNYQATAAGTTRVLVEMWGAGGGGVSSNNTNGGGGGGYTSYEVDLNQGDIISVQAASGGQGGNSANTVAAINAGGYPDGGAGWAPAFTAFNGGAGGGSRLYVRAVLAAVAGGGGGGAYGSVGYQYFGGPGGGTSGGNSDATGGGTQTAGGGSSGNGLPGSFLQGGAGGTTQRIAGNGPGGGGGYYGGGAGGANTGGGGGSGYVNTAIAGFRAGSTQAGSGFQAAGQSSPNYVAGIGRGTTGQGPQIGGNGLIVITNITPTPAATSGDLGPDITTTPITSFGLQIGLPVSKPNATVTIEPPVGYYGFPGFPTMQPFDHAINLLPVESNPTSNALVIVPINDSQSIHLSPPLNAPLVVPAEGTGELPTVTVTAPDGSVPNSATGDLGTAITLTPVEATTDVVPPVETSGDVGTITIEPLLGDGSINYNGYAGGNVGTVTLTPPNGSADPGSPHVIEDMPPAIVVSPPAASLTIPATTSGGLGPAVVLTPAEAFTGIEGNPLAVLPEIQVVGPLVSVNTSTGDDVQVFADPGQIFVRPPLGDGLEITEANYVDGLSSPLVLTFSAPEGSARGDVQGSDFLPTIWTSAVDSFVQVEGTVVGYTGDFIILTSPPLPVYDSAANLSVAMPSAIVINGADGDPSFDITLPLPGPISLTSLEGVAQGGYGAQLPPPILITPPEPAIFGNASGSPGTVQVTPPVSFVETPAFASGGLPTVTLSPPLGNALGGVAAGTSGSLPTIAIVAPEGGNVAEAAVNANLTTVFLNAPVPLPQASVAISGPSNTINVLTPAGSARVSTSTSGDVGVITIVTPEGIGYLYEEGFASGSVGTVTVTPPAPAVTAAANKSAALPTVVVTPPDALPIVPGEPVVSIGTVVVTPPEGMGFPDTVTGTGDIGTVVLTSPAGTGMVPALVTGPMAAAIAVSPPAITRVNVSGDIGLITVTPPSPAQVSGEVNLSRPINLTISLTAPDGLGYPVIPGDASGGLGPAITITASDGTAQGEYNMIVPLSTIPVSAPEALAQGDALAVQQGELPVVISPPAGEYYREASVILGLPTIYIFAPNATVDADDKTAAVTPELPVIYIEGVDGYAEVPVVDGTARIQFLRSMTPGAVPASLEAREIAFNEIDGIMYSRDGSGVLRPTPWGTLRRESIPASIGTVGQTYRADGSWAAPQPVYDAFVQGVPASGVRVALGETFVGQSTRTPTSGTPYYSPFFVPRTVSISSLAVDIQSADMGVAQVAIWTMDTDRVLGQALVSATVPTTASGVQSAASTSVVLQPGWYAASLTYLGLGAPVFRVMEGPAQIATDFTTQQGTPAYVLANLQ
ncbi:putative lectin-like domain protein [Caulobacter phage CcrColossus]|uniref:receptor protein-tyrosine kinase n=1 Tax=Caulobacter phage CcrColossus TaxID=1211640 RepID=K4JS82_9CAUD|nr:putative lectin-like domain protein [Caulobacter phage CcrColossus]AFU87961.1 putative lectin-like domain protein [Caulobacter phage CcrColossus]